MTGAADLAPLALVAFLVLLLVIACGDAFIAGIRFRIGERRSGEGHPPAPLTMKQWGPVVVHPDGSTAVCTAV